MSPQQNRFRVIHLHSRRSGQSIEQLKEAMHALLKEYDSVPSLQRNLLHREVCFATSDAPSLFQSANVSGSHSAHDIIVILDFVSREGWEEMRRDPQILRIQNTISNVEVVLCEEIMTTTKQ